jgi:hypothetical protein
MQRVFKPSLPSDVVISFYVHTQKLVMSVYQLCVNQSQKIDIQSKYQVNHANHRLAALPVCVCMTYQWFL